MSDRREWVFTLERNAPRTEMIHRHRESRRDVVSVMPSGRVYALGDATTDDVMAVLIGAYGVSVEDAQKVERR